jgi:DNA-directed RNA polymerase subunit RPC12/RpoP
MSVAARKFTGDSADLFVCIDCGRKMARVEAETRRFNAGACGHCGGKIVPDANLLHAEQHLAAAREHYRRVTGRWPRSS